MAVAKHERRRCDNGSLICENGPLRLRVAQDGRSLALAIEARAEDETWGPWSLTTSGADLLYVSANGARHAGVFFAFDPVELRGQTQGVVLYGHLGEASLTLTALLSTASTWCHLRLLVNGITQSPCRRLMQSWRLPDLHEYPALCWPQATVRQQELAGNPAAFLQQDALFAALVPKLEAEELDVNGLQFRMQECPLLEYGIWDGEQRAWDLAEPVRLSYSLCLDTRALPERGYQQVVRMLGARDDLVLVGRTAAQPTDGALPELPATPSASEWHPFLWEGTPEAITALVRDMLARAAAGEWPALETGLVWLDRLCLHQRLLDVSGEVPPGAFGDSPRWATITCWMPSLLLQAFRLTGIPEYAFRGLAALNALPAHEQAVALGQLQPTFGDIFVQAEFREVIALSGTEVTAADFTVEGVCLELEWGEQTAPVRVVMDGIEDQYALVVNGRDFGQLPLTTLRDGIIVERT